jgi:hypothetical protein
MNPAEEHYRFGRHATARSALAALFALPVRALRLSAGALG